MGICRGGVLGVAEVCVCVGGGGGGDTPLLPPVQVPGAALAPGSGVLRDRQLLPNGAPAASQVPRRLSRDRRILRDASAAPRHLGSAARMRSRPLAVPIAPGMARAEGPCGAERNPECSSDDGCEMTQPKCAAGPAPRQQEGAQ